MENESNEKPFIDAERLQEIREQADWEKLFYGLGLERNAERSNHCDWWAYSPFEDTDRPSFHLNSRGLWYDFAIREGGGTIELVQKFYDVNCYEAGQIILENNWLCSNPTDERDNPKLSPVNQPIRQDLRSQLEKEKHHPFFENLGISKDTCHQLGCGYLSQSRGMLNESLVFQVRGIQESGKGFETTILSHIGFRLDQENQSGWVYYDQFHPESALYNIDNLFLNPQALEQIKTTGNVLLLTDPLDVAKSWESGIYNVISPAGKSLTASHKFLLELIQSHLKPKRFIIWNHRAEDESTQNMTASILGESGFYSEFFDWNQTFKNPKKSQNIPIPSNITSPKNLSVRQLQWLRKQGII